MRLATCIGNDPPYFAIDAARTRLHAASRLTRWIPYASRVPHGLAAPCDLCRMRRGAAISVPPIARFDRTLRDRKIIPPIGLRFLAISTTICRHP